MKKNWKLITTLLSASLIVVGIVFAQSDYITKIYFDTGGDRMVVKDGGEIQLNSGATVDIQSGTVIADASANYNFADNYGILLGTDDDYELYFDGTNVIESPNTGMWNNKIKTNIGWHNASEVFELFEDWICADISAGPGDSSIAGWYCSSDTGKNGYTLPDSAGGVLKILTTSQDDGLNNSHINNTSIVMDSTKEIWCEWRVALGTHTAYQLEAAFGLAVADSTVIAGTEDGIYFRIVDGDSVWRGVVEDATTELTDSLILLPASGNLGWNTLGFHFDGEGTDCAVWWYANGVLIDSIAGTSNLPIGGKLTPFRELKKGEGTTAGQYLLEDWYRIVAEK